jgi:hypothetical protein
MGRNMGRRRSKRSAGRRWRRRNRRREVRAAGALGLPLAYLWLAHLGLGHLRLPGLCVRRQHPLDARERGDDALVIPVLGAANVFVQKPAPARGACNRRLDGGEFVVSVVRVCG